MAVKEALHFRVIAEEGVEHRLRGKRGSERQIAAAQALGARHEIRYDALVFACEHFPRAPEAGHHFVGDEEDAVAVAPRAKLRQHPSRPEAHARRALHQRFNHDDGDIIHGNGVCCARFRAHQEFLHRRDVRGWEMKRREAPVKSVDAAETRCAHGVAVVGVGKREKAVALRLPPVLPALHGHLDGALNSCAAVVGKEDAGERVRDVLRPKRDEFLGKLDRLGVGESQERSVRHALQLVADGSVDLRVAMAVDVGPDGGVAVDVFAPLAIAQDGPLAFHQHERFVLGRAPVAHLGERMPAMAFVGGDEIGCHGFYDPHQSADSSSSSPPLFRQSPPLDVIIFSIMTTSS